MAAVTFTSSEATALKQIHAGLNVVRSRWVSDGVTSVSGASVVYLAKVPNGAIITDGYITGGMGNITTGSIKVGLIKADQTTFLSDNPLNGKSITSDCLVTTLSITASNNSVFNKGMLPIKVSISDNTIPDFAWVYATWDGNQSSSATGSLNLVLHYLSNATS